GDLDQRHGISIPGAGLNDTGWGPYSNITKPIVVGTPTAPTIGTALAGSGSATVTWTPPTTDNGSPNLAHVVTPYAAHTPASVGNTPVASGLAGPAAPSRTIRGLTPGTTYRFRVRPHNAWGAGVFSKASNAISALR